jgi:hypothetical protein
MSFELKSQLSISLRFDKLKTKSENTQNDKKHYVFFYRNNVNTLNRILKTNMSRLIN